MQSGRWRAAPGGVGARHCGLHGSATVTTAAPTRWATPAPRMSLAMLSTVEPVVSTSSTTRSTARPCGTDGRDRSRKRPARRRRAGAVRLACVGPSSCSRSLTKRRSSVRATSRAITPAWSIPRSHHLANGIGTPVTAHSLDSRPRRPVARHCCASALATRLPAARSPWCFRASTPSRKPPSCDPTRIVNARCCFRPAHFLQARVTRADTIDAPHRMHHAPTVSGLITKSGDRTVAPRRSRSAMRHTRTTLRRTLSTPQR